MNSPTSDSLIEATSDLELCLFKIGELTVLWLLEYWQWYKKYSDIEERVFIVYYTWSRISYFGNVRKENKNGNKEQSLHKYINILFGQIIYM